MGIITRSTALRVAAVLSLVVAAIGIAFYDIPTLRSGADAEGPFLLVLGSFTSDVLALVAAYGAWRGQKWGAVLLILVNAFWIVQAMSTLLFESGWFPTVFASVMLVHHVAVILLCLWQERVVAKVA